MSIRNSALKGSAYASGALIAGRGATFVAQIVLGWVLSEGNFATFAIVVGILNFTNALSYGGANLLMFQSSDRLDSVLPSAMKIAVVFELCIALAVAIIARPLTQFYDQPELAPVLWILAGAIPLRLLGLPYQARAAAAGRFAEVSVATLIQSVVQQLLMIFFALCGFGVFSFILGQPLVNLVDWIILRRKVPPLEPSGFNPTPVRSLIRPSAFILIAAVGVSLSVGTLENLILGELCSAALLANYFFGYRLTASFGMVFGAGIRTVLIPSLAKLKSDPDRMRTAALNSTHTFFFIAVPMCICFAIMVGLAIHLIWQGKWDAAGVVAFVLLMGLPGRFGFYLGRSFLESKGQWTTTAILTWIDGGILAAVVILVASSNDLAQIAWTIGIYRGLSGYVLAMIAFLIGGAKFLQTASLLIVQIIGLAAISITYYFRGDIIETTPTIANSFATLGVFVLAYGVLAVAFLQKQGRQALAMLTPHRPAS